MPEEKHIIIDFDSTIARVETLDELAAVSLRGRPDGKRVLGEIKAITRLGMEGKIPFHESLSRRLRLLNANRKHVGILARSLRTKLSKSFLRNKRFFREHKDRIYVISGGFRELIAPVLKPFGIAEGHIYANAFQFDAEGNIVGVDKSSPLAHEGGKARQLEALGLRGEVHILGDAGTDCEMKRASPAAKFFAFTENVRRDSAVEKADHVVSGFDEYLYINKLPSSVSYPKNRIRFLLLEGVHESGARRLREEGFTVETLAHGLPEDRLAGRLGDACVLGVRSATSVTERSLDDARRLIAVGAFCVGTNNIDLDACTRRGIPVFNAPYSNTRSVAELVVAEIAMLMRNVFEQNLSLHQGVWKKSAGGSFEVRGKKLGIIGYGNIGSQVSVLAEAMGMEVYYFDIMDKLSLGNARRCGSMKEVLRKADAVTVHVDGNPGNAGLIGNKEFGWMKPGSCFLNLSRGHVVDVASLARHLRSGRLRGAAIDVFPKEPKGSGESFASELRGLANVILTPHIGGSTLEAQENIARFVTGRLVDYINAGDTLHSVNFPEVKLPVLKGAHRFLHIHKNVPGMLSQINTIFARHKINIEGQYLKTNEEIGYVITDISSKHDAEVSAEIRNIPGTVKFRVLY